MRPNRQARRTSTAPRPDDCRACPARAVVLSETETECTADGLGVRSRSHDPAIEAFDEKMRRPESVGALQEASAVGGVSERLDQDQAEAEAVRDARAEQSSVRSHLGGADVQPAEDVPVGADLGKRRRNGSKRREQPSPSGLQADYRRSAREARRSFRSPKPRFTASLPPRTTLSPCGASKASQLPGTQTLGASGV